MDDVSSGKIGGLLISLNKATKYSCSRISTKKLTAIILPSKMRFDFTHLGTQGKSMQIKIYKLVETHKKKITANILH